MSTHDDAAALAVAVRTLLAERRYSPEVIAAELEVPEVEVIAALSDLAHADSWWSYALAGLCGRQLSDVAREAGL